MSAPTKAPPAPSTGAVREQPRVAVYRTRYLPRSETFVRDHLVRMPRYRTSAVVKTVLPDALPVPGVRPVVPLNRRLYPRVEDAALHRLRRPGHLAAAVPLAAALRSTGADLVHVHFGVDAAYALPAVRLSRLPLVVTFHGYDATTRPEVMRGNPWGRLLVDGFDDLMEHAARVVTVSEYLRGRLVARGAPEDKIRVIPCGVDPSSVPAPAPPPTDGPLLFVGRLTEKKGLGDLLEALAGLTSPPELLVVGDGHLRQDLERRARDLRVRARFLGMQPSSEVGALMDRASALCLPSKTASDGDCEGLPVTALEAGLHGRPVVGYAHSGIPEAVLHGRTGLLAEEGDVDGLRHELARACGDADLRARLGAAARERVVAEFSTDLLLGRLADVYDEVVRPRR